MNKISQNRALIVGLGYFGLWAQTYLWRRLNRPLQWRYRNSLTTSEPAHLLNFLLLLAKQDSGALCLARPCPERWNHPTFPGWSELQPPEPSKLQDLIESTMEEFEILRQPLREPRRDTSNSLFRRDVFDRCITSRVLLQQQLQDALFKVMGDQTVTDDLVHVTVYVICDLTEELASAMLWPILHMLRQVLNLQKSAELIPVLSTGAYVSAPHSTLHDATVYLALRELECLSTWDTTRSVPDWLREMLPDAYWRAQLGELPFDRCYLMDQEKWHGAVTRDPGDVLVALGNAMEVMLLTEAADRVRDQLATDKSFLESIGSYKPLSHAFRAEFKSEASTLHLSRTPDRPYGNEPVRFHKGVYSSWGAASIYLPVDTLDQLGRSWMYIWALKRWFLPREDKRPLARGNLAAYGKQTSNQKVKDSSEGPSVPAIDATPADPIEPTVESYIEMRKLHPLQRLERLRTEIATELPIVLQAPTPGRAHHLQLPHLKWQAHELDERQLLKAGSAKELLERIDKEWKTGDKGPTGAFYEQLNQLRARTMGEAGPTPQVAHDNHSEAKDSQADRQTEKQAEEWEFRPPPIFSKWISEEIEALREQLADMLSDHNQGLRDALILTHNLRQQLCGKADNSDLRREEPTSYAYYIRQFIKEERRRQKQSAPTSTSVQQERERFVRTWHERPRFSAVVARVYLIALLTISLVWHTALWYPHILPQTLYASVVLTIIAVAFLGARAMLRHGTWRTMNEWKRIHHAVIDEASIHLTLETYEMLTRGFYEELDCHLAKVERALQDAQDALKSEYASVQQAAIELRQVHAHFLRTSQQVNLETQMFLEWSRAIRKNLEEQPLLSPYRSVIEESLRMTLPDLNHSEAPHSEATNNHSGKPWSELILKELNSRIDRYGGDWYGAGFELETELIKRYPQNLLYELRLLRERARPFIPFAEDVFEQDEVFWCDFLAVNRVDTSPAISALATALDAVSLSSYDPFSITFFRSCHGLNLWQLSLLERCQEAYRRLHEDDWKRLVFDQRMVNPAFGFAERPQELRLPKPLFGDSELKWKPPAETRKETDEPCKCLT